MVKISCIIPVYNTQDYLASCLDSVIGQTLKDIEIIIVNDGSTDDSLSVIKQYQKNNPCINLINYEIWQGVSIARNVAMKIAVGEYIFFLDSDDRVLDNNAFSDLYTRMKSQDLDMLIFDYSKVYKKSITVKTRWLKEDKIYMTKEDKQTILLATGVACWHKIYKREFLIQNSLWFYEKIFYEDIPFFWQSTILASKIGYCKNQYYKYIQRKGSIINSVLTLAKAKDVIIAIQDVKIFLEKSNNMQNYKKVFAIKVLKTFPSYIKRIIVQDRHEFFNMVSDNIAFIHLADYRDNLSFVRYLKYYLIQHKYYFLYRAIFLWF